MTEEVRTRACTECGWPALAGTRRCPYCRGPFPAVRPARLTRPADPLRWLMIAWVAAIVPTVLLALTTLGASLALLALAVSLTPGLLVWALRRRSAARIDRFRGRGQSSRPATSRGPKINHAGSGNPSTDARR